MIIPFIHLELASLTMHAGKIIEWNKKKAK
jgi:hypothetical protein